MNTETARFVIDQLQKNFGRKFAAEALNKIKPDLLKEPDRAAENAYDYILLNFNPPNMPTAGKLLEIVQNEGCKISQAAAIQREEEAREEKRRAANIFKSPAQTELAERSLLIIKGILSPKPDYGALLDGMRAMAVLYPKSEWWKVGADFEKAWSEKGLI